MHTEKIENAGRVLMYSYLFQFYWEKLSSNQSSFLQCINGSDRYAETF